MIVIALELPFPPSVNHYWGQSGKTRYIRTAGLKFRAATADQVAKLGEKIEGRLAVFVSLFPPDQRRRDIDNSLKALLDALQHAGLFDDDEQIDMLQVKRKEVTKGGKCCVMVTHV